MASKDSNTEQLIKDTAKRVFFTEGRLQATTQDIADAAGVSRTSLHYYFRSRDVLIAQVFDEAIASLSNRLYDTMSGILTFRKKMEAAIDIFLKETIAYPYRETFLVQEMLAGSASLDQQKQLGAVKMKPFLQEIEAEMKAGRLMPMEPEQFMMNVIALTAHPLMMQPLHQKTFNLSDARYQRLMKERKQLIIDMLFGSPSPKSQPSKKL